MTIKVGLYLANGNVSEVDLSDPEQGNPGVGGTEYMTVCLPHYFNKYQTDEVEFTWYANNTKNLPSDIRAKKSPSIQKAAEKAENDQCDIFIWRPTSDENRIKFAGELQNYDLDFIAWAHNFIGSEVLRDYLYGADNLKRVVCLTDEELDTLRDHPIIQKAVTIHYGFDTRAFDCGEIISDSKNVVYVGSIRPVKGFHLLAQAWPAIKERVPEAQLKVIGSGKLYNRNQSLGKWGVAEESYESELIRPYLSDDKGEIQSSVEFCGALGEEKIPIMQNARVGVVNPSGKTETFCISAIEFQSAGTPVVTARYGGLFETVEDGSTGFLINNQEELVDKVVFFLKNESKSRGYGRTGQKFVKSSFRWDKISNQWMELFHNIMEGKSVKVKPIQKNILHRNKILREAIRLGRKFVPYGQHLPTIKKIKQFVPNYTIRTIKNSYLSQFDDV